MRRNAYPNKVPRLLVSEACRISEARFFKPNKDGLAARRDPGAGEREDIQAEAEDVKDDGQQIGSDGEHEMCDDDGDSQQPPVFNEQLLGLDVAHGNDPLRQVMLQRRMQLLQEEGDKVVRRQCQYHAQEQQSDALNVAVQSGIEQCRQYFLDVRDVANKMTQDE